MAVVFPGPTGGAEIVTVGGLMNPNPGVVSVIAETLPPVNVAVAVAAPPPPPVMVTIGGATYPEPPFVTVMLLSGCVSDE